MHRELIVGAIAAASLVGLSACHVHHHVWISGGDTAWSDDGDRTVSVGDRLDCPDAQGALQKVSAAPDGRSCVYKRGDDEDVVLSLVALNGQPPRAAMAPMEAELAQLTPVHPGPGPVSIDASQGNGDDRAKIDLPGLHIDAHGDKAKVSVLGMTVDADNDHANVHAGEGDNTATVHAGPGGAEIRADRVGAHSVNLVYVLAGDTAGPSGYRADGYIARGPLAGPLVVGEFKSKTNDQGHHDHDLESLIELNLHNG